MVRFAYQDIANSYHEVKQAACGRQACSVMIMVANEVDAMASCKMLTQLLRSDNIAYTIRPVLNFDEVVHTYQSFMTDDIKSIFMLNCGALYNIPKTFDLERGGDVRVFILDNHRPLHLANIYSKHSVVVFDDNYDVNEEDSESLPSDGSELSGGISSSDSDSSSEGYAEDDEDMFNEELEAADIDAAFRNPAEGEEDAELEDDDDNNDNSDADNDNEDAEEAEEAADGEEEVGEGSAEGSDEEGKELGSDEERSEDSASEEEDSQAGSAADDEGEGEADVTVEYNDLGEVLPKKQKGTGKRKQAKAPRGGPSTKSHKRSRVGAAEGAGAGIGSTRTGSDTALDESLLSEWDAAGTQERRRTRDLYSADDPEGDAGDAEEQAEESDDQEENMQIKGRKRRTAEAEEVLRAKERRRGLNRYYASPGIKTAPTSLMLTGLMADQLGSRQMPTEVVWQAVLGVTSQYLSGHLHEGLYSEYCHFLKTQFGDALRTSTERNTYSVRASEDPVVPAVAAGSSDIVRGEESELMLVPGSENGHVEEAAEYRFFLYRHWSLYDAMFHSPYVASKLSVWNHQGTAKLQELLARMGVPLQQCKQAYQYMTPVLRNHFAQQMADQNILDTYNFTNPGVTFKSFYRYNAFKNPIAASDIVHAATALTEMYGAAAYSASSLSAPAITAAGGNGVGGEEHTDHADGNGSASSSAVVVSGAAAGKISSIDAFYDAYYCLGMKSDELMQKGIQAALDLQRTIVKKASAMLDGNSSIHRSNRLYYACINRTSTSSWGPGASSSAAGGSGAAGGGRGGFADTSSSSGAAAALAAGGAEIEHSFGRPMVLAKLGQYIMDIKRNIPKKNGGWTGSALLPLILLSEKQDSTFLVVGISPLSSLSGGEALTEEQERKLAPLTNFRQFFKLAGQLLGAPVRHISFDANVVEVRREDVQEFLGALDDSLRKATPRYNSTAV